MTTLCKSTITGLCLLACSCASLKSIPGTSAVTNANYASTKTLASGSSEAQMLQKSAVGSGLPLEVKLSKTGISFRLIPAGTFTMGSPVGEEWREADEAQKEVIVSHTFYMGKFEISQAQWRQVLDANPSGFKNAGADAPVENLDWNDCQTFLRRLEQLEGLKKGALSLPSELQWEYACRAGTSGKNYTGETKEDLKRAAWYGANIKGTSKHTTNCVGQKIPNAWGLYDMYGNVWEWCDSSYANTDKKVIRGGGWIGREIACRSADTRGFKKSAKFTSLGLRIILKLKL